MNRSEWISKARELLADNPEAAELLAVELDAPTVIVGEVIDDDELEAEGLGAKATAPPSSPRPSPSSTKLARQGTRAHRNTGALARAARFGVRKLTEPDEPRLYGTERLEVGVHNLTEKAVDKGLDALEGVKEKLPSLRSRGAAFAGRRLGRGAKQ